MTAIQQVKTISKHCSFEEAVSSFTGKRLGIKNVPTASGIKTMRITAEAVFEPVRGFFKVPIIILSFWRSRALNDAVGGSATSQHMIGEAIDIESTGGTVGNSHLFHYIKNNLVFDQVIWEFGTNTNPAWVHVSYTTKRKNRMQALKAVKINGKTVYKNLP